MSDFQGAEDAASKILSIAQEQEDSWSKRRGISTAYRLLNKIFEGQCEWQKAAECPQKMLMETMALKSLTHIIGWHGCIGDYLNIQKQVNV